MSRTIKGSKSPGFDYWNRRYGNASGSNCPGGKGRHSTKRITNRAERRTHRIEAGLSPARLPCAKIILALAARE